MIIFDENKKRYVEISMNDENKSKISDADMARMEEAFLKFADDLMIGN